MKVDIDLEAILKGAQEMPEELATPDEVPAALRPYYDESETGLKLNKQAREGLVSELSSALEKDRLHTENAKLKEDANRRLVVETVRGQLSRLVRPELMSGAVALFMSQHKFDLKDGKVIAVNKLGAAEAELSSVSWIADEGAQYATLAAKASTGGFVAEVARLKSTH